jgi:transforming growth factor-beta-induced protein
MMLKKRIGLLVLPAVVFAAAACEEDATEAAPQETVVDVAVAVNASTGEFSTLIAALTAAGLVDDLSSPGPFTVFAPTDAAFAAADLNAANIGSVPVETLRSILLYHVVPGRLLAQSVVGASSLTMVSGGTTSISLNGSNAFIDDAQIVQTDIPASNGIIHVIDAVLMP